MRFIYPSTSELEVEIPAMNFQSPLILLDIVTVLAFCLTILFLFRFNKG